MHVWPSSLSIRILTAWTHLWNCKYCCDLHHPHILYPAPLQSHSWCPQSCLRAIESCVNPKEPGSINEWRNVMQFQNPKHDICLKKKTIWLSRNHIYISIYIWIFPWNWGRVLLIVSYNIVDTFISSSCLLSTSQLSPSPAEFLRGLSRLKLHNNWSWC